MTPDSERLLRRNKPLLYPFLDVSPREMKISVTIRHYSALLYWVALQYYLRLIVALTTKVRNGNFAYFGYREEQS
jgi:hypothetical protein